MLFLFLLFVVGILSIPLYLDYKKDPANNLVVNNLKIVSSNSHIQKIIAPIVPHANKYGIDSIFIFPAIVLLVLILLVLIF